MNLTFYPKHGHITNMSPGIEYDQTRQLNGIQTDKAYIADYAINYRNTGRLFGTVQRIFHSCRKTLIHLIRKVMPPTERVINLNGLNSMFNIVRIRENYSLTQ